jgi:hypothetical protein
MKKSISLAIAVVLFGAAPALAKGEEELAKCMWEKNPASTELFRLAHGSDDKGAALNHYLFATSGCSKPGKRRINTDKLFKMVTEFRPAEIGEDTTRPKIFLCEDDDKCDEISK